MIDPWEWLIRKAIPEPNSGCWLWEGALLQHNGYGTTRVSKKVLVRAHRRSWEIFVDPIPEGKKVLHRCDVPSCVCPDHLWLGTQGENLKDMRRKNRRHYDKHNLKLVEKILLAKGSGRKIAKEFKVSESFVSTVQSGKLKRKTGNV